MRPRIAIIYNDEPNPDRYQTIGEASAVLGVLEEVTAVHQALAELGYPVEQIPLSPPLEQAREKLENLKADLVFNIFEGFADCPETEAAVANFLSELGLTYTGCPAAALSLGLDKAATKRLLAANGIATPRYQLLTPAILSLFHLDYPCIIKPPAEDASHGLSAESVVNDAASLEKQVSRISQFYGGQALVEEFIDGREFNATVIGNGRPEVLPISEIIYSLPPGMPRILTFAAKWEPGSLYFQCSQVVCPAEIDTKTQQSLIATALDAFRLIGGSGYTRVDFRMNTAGIPKVIEVNPNPDISPEYGAARQAQAAGLSYNQFIQRIVLLALEKEKMTRIKTRPMTGGDKAAIMPMLGNTPEFKPSEVIVAGEVLDSYLDDPAGSGYQVLVAEAGAVVVGYICYGLAPLTEGTWDIYWLAVAPRQQRQGIGRRLLAAAEDKIKEAQGRLILIETSSLPGYERTRRFYQSQGYAVVGQIADFYAPGDDEVIFQKRLR